MLEEWSAPGVCACSCKGVLPCNPRRALLPPAAAVPHVQEASGRATVVLQWRLHPHYRIGEATVGELIEQFQSGARGHAWLVTVPTVLTSHPVPRGDGGSQLVQSACDQQPCPAECLTRSLPLPWCSPPCPPMRSA